MDAGKAQVELEEGVKAALIVGNRLRGGEKIANRSTCAQIGLDAKG